MVATHPLHGEREIDDIIHSIDAAGRIALGHARPDDVEVRAAVPVDLQKFDGAGVD